MLDEPTAPLDAGTEAALVQSLNEATRGMTVVCVTHRGAMLQMLERLIVVDAGRIIMDGPRDTVLESLKGQQ